MIKKVRILLAKAGLDGHDRGIKVVARTLKEAGFEVIYTGLHRTPEEIINAAIQEDVDGIGISILSGAHLEVFGNIAKLMKKNKIADKLLFGGGTIPDDDVVKLKKIGVSAIFTPGTSLKSIIEFLHKYFS